MCFVSDLNRDREFSRSLPPLGSVEALKDYVTQQYKVRRASHCGARMATMFPAHLNRDPVSSVFRVEFNRAATRIVSAKELLQKV